MSTQFEAKYKIVNCYCKTAPVAIAEAGIYKAEGSDYAFAQIKFQSVDERTITEVQADFKFYGSAGQLTETVEGYKFDSSGSGFGAIIGLGKLIMLKDNDAQSFEISNIKVVFEDGTEWAQTAADIFKPMPQQQELIDVFGDNELVDEYSKTVSNRAGLTAVEYEDAWVCTCGIINKADKCVSCGADKTIALKLSHAENMKAFSESKKEKDAAAAEIAKKEMEKAEKEADADAKSKKKKFIIIAIIAIIVITAAVIAGKAIQKNSQYNEAIEYMENGSYESANIIFKELGDYKDAEKYLKYNDALDYKESGQNSEAAKLFKKLGNFEDSKKLLGEIKTKAEPIVKAEVARMVKDDKISYSDRLMNNIEALDSLTDDEINDQMIGYWKIINNGDDTDVWKILNADGTMKMIYQFNRSKKVMGSTATWEAKDGKLTWIFDDAVEGSDRSKYQIYKIDENTYVCTEYYEYNNYIRCIQVKSDSIEKKAKEMLGKVEEWD